VPRRIVDAGNGLKPEDHTALFVPLRIRDLALRNRFVMPAMQRGFTDDGAPTPRMVEHLRRCAGYP
jgi:2,4-dienoyl-CoA reductase-like NADH-dependent reductase (Old Yellow Enzyme family)